MVAARVRETVLDGAFKRLLGSATGPSSMSAGEKPDFERLEGYFSALSYSTRLELLHLLRYPRELAELKVSPKQVRPGENPERPISRQALLEHLDRLMEIGVVVAREPTNPRDARLFEVNGAQLYRILEEFRAVGTVFAGAAAGRGETAPVGSSASPRLEPGPKLVLVHGLREGQVFPLHAATLAGERGFVIGRKDAVHVSLGYDPFVSLENSEIVVERGEHRLMDLRSSRNGTWLNWRALEKDERAPLRSGDVIGVGRSLLVFRAD